MKLVTAEYLTEDYAWAASMKIRSGVSDDLCDTNVIKLENQDISSGSFPKERFTLLTTDMVNYTGVFITDPVVTEVAESSINEDMLKERSLLSVICSDSSEKAVSDIILSTSGENIHISSF